MPLKAHFLLPDLRTQKEDRHNNSRLQYQELINNYNKFIRAGKEISFDKSKNQNLIKGAGKNEQTT